MNEEYLKVSDFNNVGLLHNEFLTASDIAFPQGLDPADPNYIQIANQFNQNLILDQTVLNKYGIAVNDAIGFQNALSFWKPCLIKENLYTYLDSSNPNRVKLTFQTLTQTQKISSFGGALMSNFLDDVQANLEGSLSNDALQTKVNSYITQYDTHNYLTESGEGMVIGTILAISKNSLDRWLNPTNTSTNQGGPRIAPWLAMDLLGAACGAGSSLLSDYWNDQPLNWKSAAAWGLGTAVCGSVGVRITRGR